MTAVIWKIMSPYITPLLVGLLVILLCISITLSIRLKLQSAKTTELTAQLNATKLTLNSLKREADAQANRLATAEAASHTIETRTAVRIKYIKETALPQSATCDEAAAWAKKVAMERPQ